MSTFIFSTALTMVLFALAQVFLDASSSKPTGPLSFTLARAIIHAFPLYGPCRFVIAVNSRIALTIHAHAATTVH